jgi:hypothetical protein
MILKRIMIFCCFITACRTSNKVQVTPDFSPGSSVLVYKTKADYSKNVPVILSADKSKIVSYPHPTDVKPGGKFQYPLHLKDGYLLDNRGISENVAFLKLTYEEYSKMTEAPPLKDLYAMIIDKDPLVQMCNCGNKKAFKDLPKELNDLIKSKELTVKCKKVK